MTARFNSDSQRQLFGRVTSALGSIGYRGELLETDYEYRNYLAPGAPSQTIHAACFGRLPVDYETALLGIAASNDESGRALANSHRALCSPLIVEVGEQDVRVWSVGLDDSAAREASAPLSAEHFRNWVSDNADKLSPTEFLRTKNLREGESYFFQRSLFAGLIPELEDRIAGILEPRLAAACRAGIAAYKSETGRTAPEDVLFKLTFWLLTGKVFCDRRHPKFTNLANSAEPGEVLERVAQHYNDASPGRLLNESTRQAVFDRIWDTMDFRHLSVEVLSQIWSRTLVTKDTRKRLGIHRTPYSIVRYILDKMPLEPLPATGRFIVEPCCGSAVFLVAALNKMRDIIGTSMTALERHRYFKKVLRGFDRDPFGIEIGKLCLALSDYPNPNRWLIDRADVLTSGEVQQALTMSHVVLCNPPYGRFDKDERKEYPGHAVYRALAILNRVLDSLSPDGMLGFVLPRLFIDNVSFRAARERIASRFESVELVSLPDKGWEFADQETVLLLATQPASKQLTRALVKHKKVIETDWRNFDWHHRFTSEHSRSFTRAEAAESLAIPELETIWRHLRRNDRLGMRAGIHRGLQWNKPVGDEEWKRRLIRQKEFPNSAKGIDPESGPLYSFVPHLKISWLDTSDENKGNNARDYEWDKTKVILNAVTRSRGKWRIAAFVDSAGLVTYQNLTGIWPHDPRDVTLFAAIINGPLANAYITDHEGKRHITIETIESIPLPRIDDKLRRDVEALVADYINSVHAGDEALFTQDRYRKADEMLRRLDARVLRAYQLTPRQERLLLDYFNDDYIHYGRQVPFEFRNYFPEDMEMYLTLHEYLSPKRQQSTMGRLLNTPKPPQSVRDALKSAAEMHMQ
ncbi:MAG: SAM-dependent methyltransferase [Planctomycetaceae bacterium]|nr:SAM-dependent methyltransferase [Planctomycetaceae bacterium]